MATRRDRDIKYKETLKDITVADFDRVLNGDYTAMLVGYKDLEIIRLTDTQLTNAREAWGKLYEAFMDRTGTQEDLQLYLIKGQIEAAKLKRKVCNALIGCLRLGRPAKIEEQYMDELGAWGYPMDKAKPIVEEIDRVERLVKTIDNDLALLQMELKEFQGDDKNKEPLDLVRLKVKLKISADVEVDLERTNMHEWLLIWEELDKQAKRLEKKLQKTARYE